MNFALESAQSMKPEDAGNEFLVVRPENSIYALGLAVKFLMAEPEYARQGFGDWSRVLFGCVARGHYYFVVEGDYVQGLVGWAYADEERAEAWVEGRADLSDDDCRSGTCIIINVSHALTKAASRFMLDHLQKTHPNIVKAFAKRHYADGRIRPMKLSLDKK